VKIAAISEDIDLTNGDIHTTIPITEKFVISEPRFALFLLRAASFG